MAAAADTHLGGDPMTSVAVAVEPLRAVSPEAPASHGSSAGAAEQRAESRRRRERVCEKIGSYHHREGAAAKCQVARIPLLQRLVPMPAAAVVPAPEDVAASSSCPSEALQVVTRATQPPPQNTEVGSLLAVVGAPAAAGGVVLAVAPKAAGEAASKWKPAAAPAAVRAAGPAARRRQPVEPTSILPTADANLVDKCNDLTTTGPLQIAIVKADGELELQTLTSDDLKRSAKHQVAKKEAMRQEIRKKIEVQEQVRLVKPAHYKKKGKAGAGVLSKLLQMHARSGTLVQEPPREAFFQAW